MFSRVVAAAIVVIGFAAHADAQRTYYVRASGNDTNDGLTPATALRTIQAGVSKCTASGGGHRVVVGPGTYNERVRVTNTVVPTPASGTLLSINSIYGDTAGALTGDPGGNVVISGGSSHLYGIEVISRSYWEIVGITFTGQTAAGVTLSAASGLAVRGCTFNPGSSASAAISSEAIGVTIERNTVVFSRAGGNGIFVRCLNSGIYTISQNSVWMTGSRYLSTAYRTSPALPINYGIYVNVENDFALATVNIANNVVTDRNVGIYANSDGLVGTTMTVTSNTVVGCTVPIYQIVTGLGIGSAVNNIVAHSYGAGKYEMSLGSLSGLLTWNTPTGFLASVLTQSGVILEQDPLFISPSSGNFRLAAGSPAIDAGTLVGAPLVDIASRPRPADGNADLLPIPDLGAHEYASSSGMRITAWNQKDQRSVPRYKLPDIKALRVGNILVP